MKSVILFLLFFAPIALVACDQEQAGAKVGVQDISRDEFVSNPPRDAIILDVRTQKEFDAGHIPQAILIPYDELSSRVSELGSETDRPIVVYCKSGRRAGIASTTLTEAGFTRILHLEGDMDGWRESGLPID